MLKYYIIQNRQLFFIDVSNIILQIFEFLKLLKGYLAQNAPS